MVYIYKKVVGKNNYYYLRVSEKKGNKLITKDLAYLGNTTDDIKKSLEKLLKYKKEIRRAYKKIHSFIESNRFIDSVKALKLKNDSFLGNKLNLIESCKIHYLKEFNNFDVLTKEETIKNFLVEFAYNTTSIEGNTIKIREAKKLLEEGKTPKNRTLREIYDLQNTEEVFFEIFKTKQKLTHELIVNTHKNLLNNIDKRSGYRNQDVRVMRANFKSTPAPYVKTDMDLLLKWYYNNKEKIHPFVLACLFHHKFERIHPFMDGNGRTGRMLLNYILLQNGYPPLVIRMKNRENYLKTMKEADGSNELFKAELEYYYGLVQFIADEMNDSYWNIFL